MMSLKAELEAGRAALPRLRERQKNIHDETPRSDKERIEKNVRLKEAEEDEHRVRNAMADRAQLLSIGKNKQKKKMAKKVLSKRRSK